MRISDWSSDVCSSDLVRKRLLVGRCRVAGNLAIGRMAGPCLDLLIATSGFREAPRCRLPETMCGAFFQARLVAPLPEFVAEALAAVGLADRKSTRLNSSH